MPGLRDKRSACSLIADYVEDPHFRSSLKTWLTERSSITLRDLLSRFADSVRNPDVAQWIANFRADVEAAYEKYNRMAELLPQEQFDILS